MGYIYAFYHKQSDECIYIGSANAADIRLKKHITDSKRNMIGPLYNYVDSLPNKWNDIYMEILEAFEIDNKNSIDRTKMLFIEREWIEKMKPKCNVRIPKRTIKELDDTQHYYWTEKLSVMDELECLKAMCS